MSDQTDPSTPDQQVGWRGVAGEPPGTLGWWNGEQFVAMAFWAVDHWEYVTDDWAGPDPPPGVLPDGAGDPRESGWWKGEDGQWHRPVGSPWPPPEGPPLTGPHGQAGSDRPPWPAPDPSSRSDLFDDSAPAWAPPPPESRWVPSTSPRKPLLPWLLVLALIVGLIVVLQAVSGSRHSSTYRSPSTTRFTTPSTVAPTTTTVPAVPFGQTQSTAGGITVTVYGAEVPAQPDPQVNFAPRLGMVFVAVDAEVCATTKEGIAQDWWFTLGTPSASQTGSPIRQPAFPTAQALPVGSCVRGWVSFEIRASDSQHVDVYFRVPGPAGSSTELRWG